MTPARRAVVIGAGMGGLTSALLLAMRGWSVTICEQHTRPGGLMHRFFREGCGYDTGFHYCGGISYDDLFGRCLRHLGVFDDLQFLPLDPDGFDRILAPGVDFRVPVGLDRYRERLQATFPDEAAGIAAFLEDLVAATHEYGLYAFRAEISPRQFLQWEGRSLQSVLDEHIRDRRLQTVLAGQWALYGLSPEEAPFGVHAVILHHFLRGAWRIQGGGDRLAAVLVRRLRALGGTLRLRAPVASVRVEGRNATGVILESGEVVPADLVISNLHPRLLLDKLPESSIRRAYRTRVHRSRVSTGHLGVYVEVDGAVPDIGNANLYRMLDHNIGGSIQQPPSEGPTFYFATAPGEAPRREGARRPHPVVLLLAPMTWERVEPWADSQHGDRPDAYRALKARAQDALVDQLCRDFPELRDRICRVESSTPLTTRHFVGAPRGAMYGHHHSVDQMGRYRLPQFIRVRQLIQVGASVLMPGVLGAMTSAYYGIGAMEGTDKMLEELNAVPETA